MSAPDTAHLRPDKIAVWPVEGDRYGIDLSYAGTTGYTRADQTHQTINASGINATFRQELGDCGPSASDPSPATRWSSSSSTTHRPSRTHAAGGATGHDPAHDARQPLRHHRCACNQQPPATAALLVQLESVASLGQGACSHAKAAADQGPYVEKL